jgi:hypothetical protein
MAMTTRTALAILFLLLSPTLSEAAEPRQETLRAWDDYIRSVNASVADRVAGTRPFLWVDDSSEIQRRVQHGELVVRLPLAFEHPTKGFVDAFVMFAPL